MDSNFLNSLPTGQLSEDLTQIYHDFRLLGYFQKYGRCCLFINSLLSTILTRKKYHVSITSCYAELNRSGGRYFLGHKAYAKPGQLAGHISCIVDHRFLVDFGLGIVKARFEPLFWQAIGCALEKNEARLSAVYFSAEKSIQWYGDSPPSSLEYYKQAQQEILEEVLLQYDHFVSNRLRFCVSKAITNISPTQRVQNYPMPLVATHGLRSNTGENIVVH
jgi:hypothetical protein